MTWLALDTSTTWLSVALWESPGGTVAEQIVFMGRDMLRKAPVTVQALMQKSHISVQGLSGLAVGIGPGSYTGVRVGMSFMQGLALARSLPLFGIKTSAAIAAGFPGYHRVCILQESGRRTGHIVVSVYDTTLFPPKECAAPAVVLPTDITDMVNLQDCLIVGPVASRVVDLLDIPLEHRADTTEERALIPQATLIAELAYQQQLAGDQGDPRNIDGVYLTIPPIPPGKPKSC